MISAKVRVCDLGQNLIMTKTSLFFSIDQENTCNSSLHFYLIILTDFHSFTVNEDKLQNKSIWRFLLRTEVTIQVKIWKWLKLLNSVPLNKKTLVYIRIWSFLTDFDSFTVNKEKLQNLSIFKFSANVRLCDLAQNLIITKTSQFFYIHQQNNCK